MESHTKPEHVRVDLLDIVRGIAALVVVLHHIFFTTPVLELIPGANIVPWWSFFLFLGELSVTLFFILSGASLAFGVVNNGGNLDLRKFYIRRFFRIYPLYVFAICIYFLVRPIYGVYIASGYISAQHWLSYQFVSPLSVDVWLRHLTMTNNIMNTPASSFNNAGWSLPVEMQFYIFFPVFIWLLLKIKWLVGILLAVLLAGACYVLQSSIEWNTLGYLWQFVGGVIIGVYWQPIVQYLHTHRWVIYFLVTISPILFIASRFEQMIYSPIIPISTLEVLFCFDIVILAFCGHTWKASTRLGNWASKIGVWSYSIYLLHNLVLGLTTPLLRTFSLSPIAYVLIASSIIYPITIGFSWLTYRYVEKPTISYGTRLIKKLEQRTPVVVSS